MPRRHSRTTRLPGAPLTILRERVAQEAARLMMEHGIGDFGQAKRKAAERLGVRESGALPSNAHIEASLAERQRIFEPDDHEDRVWHLRRQAADVMKVLASFQPRLVGPVLAGTPTVNTPIELHVFSDAPESVAAVLDGGGVTARECQRRYRFDGQTAVNIPGFRFAAADTEVVVLVFSENGLRQAPLSPVDRRPMKRAARSEVLSLLG
jgi:hypothetical protein